VVGVTGLAEAAGRRADEDERAVTTLGDGAQEATRGQERRREARSERRLPAVERELRRGDVVAWPFTDDCRTDVERAGGGEERIEACLRGPCARFERLQR
jgi:hypothetical protein